MQVQYENSVEFIQFDKREIIDPVSKIMLSEPILNIEYDLAMIRYLFVQTKTQIYLYDCDNLLQNQQAQYAPIPVQQKGCQFQRKLLPSSSSRPISNFRTVKNTVMIYFEDSSVEILYTKDLLNYFMYPKKYQIPKELVLVDSIPASGHNYQLLGQAKTQTNSLFLHMNGEHKLVVSQYIPLPAFQDLGTKSEFEDFF